MTNNESDSSREWASQAYALLKQKQKLKKQEDQLKACLLYTSPSPRDATLSRMPSSA